MGDNDDDRYFILDMRAAHSLDGDGCTVLGIEDTIAEAREAAKEQGGGVIWDVITDKMVEVVHCEG